MQLFEVCAIQYDEWGSYKEIIIAPYYLLANNEEAAKMKLLMDNASTFAQVDMNEVSILVRPFK